jgi:hypothetical protein
MSQAIFNAIESKDLAALERILESGTSPLVKNEEGSHPLSLVASLIKKSYYDGMFEDEELYKRMAAMLIVHGAPDEDLEHAFGEVSNLCRFICRYVIDLSMEKKTPDRVASLIKNKRLWFENDDKQLEADLMDAVEQGDSRRIEPMFEKGLVHFAYEQ